MCPLHLAGKILLIVDEPSEGYNSDFVSPGKCHPDIVKGSELH